MVRSKATPTRFASGTGTITFINDKYSQSMKKESKKKERMTSPAPPMVPPIPMSHRSRLDVVREANHPLTDESGVLEALNLRQAPIAVARTYNVKFAELWCYYMKGKDDDDCSYCLYARVAPHDKSVSEYTCW